MKQISTNLYIRGKNRIFYLRRRIPTAIQQAYPRNVTHVVVCLGTADLDLAKQRLHKEQVLIDAKFSQLKEEQKKKALLRERVKLEKLNDTHIRSMADFWVRQTLLSDERRRENGLDDEEFEALDRQLTEQRAQLGRMLATGRTDKILPALHSFIYLCGFDVELCAEEAHRVG